MKMRLSDFIADFLADNGVKDVFTIVGGGAMYLNDSFGSNKRLKCYYNHHEQACAIAAESYARINNDLALVCVTTGPGGINALNGVVGGYLDSIPMLIISGQVRYDTLSVSTGLPLRAMGDQEFMITNAVKSMTKYCELVVDPNKIKYCLQEALFLAKNGRPGPCWLDIPLNVQSAMIETDDLQEFNMEEEKRKLPLSVDDSVIKKIIEKVKLAKRPVFYAGNGIRLSNSRELFLELIEKMNIPVVTNWTSVDLIPDDHHLYVGRGGSMGNRAGKLAVQNSDLILSIGGRLSLRQTGFNWGEWAKNAYVIMEDVDEAELMKPTLHVDMPIHVDAHVLLENLNKSIHEKLFDGKEWLDICAQWKEKYPVVQKRQYEEKGLINPYRFMRELSLKMPEDGILVTGNGTPSAVGDHACVFKKNQRFIANSAIASMGYDLPAAIGACIANGTKDVVCVAGDGSIQMNLQELQTIVTNKLPIKLFVINNSGYHSIRMTQTNIFNKNFHGIGPQSHDLDFPDFEKLAYAYGIPYYRMDDNQDTDMIDKILSLDGFVMCEVFVTIEQVFEPRSATKKLEDGSLYSPPLEDMFPFLDREELEKNIIK